MQNTDPFIPETLAALQEEARAAMRPTPLHAAALNLQQSFKPSLFTRAKRFIKHLLGNWFRKPAPVMTTYTSPTASAAVISSLAQLSKPIVFKHTASTLVIPLGGYAGKATLKDPRASAEEQFHKLEPSRGVTIN